jgi:dCTP deaminase
MDHGLVSGPEGVLPTQDIARMVQDRLISSSPFAIESNQIQPASLDLRLGEKAYRVQCSFLPGRETVENKLSRYTIHLLNLIDGAVLEPGVVYIIPLLEKLSLPNGIRARANPRSTTGRLDIFTRVITDYGDRFDEIPDGYQGPLYLEVLSRTFPIRIARLMSLSQLRFLRGVCRCSDEEIMSLYEREGPLLYEGTDTIAPAEIVLREGLFLRVDLSGIGGTNWVGYKARRNSRLIDFGRVHSYHALDFWEPIFSDKSGRIILERDEFYLLISREKVRIPPNYAAEMVAYEQTSGELRTHYAGFFDPGFGWDPWGDVKGTVAVMEVRALDAPFMVEEGQRFCKLQLERMSATPDKVYGAKGTGSSYQFQGLTPSKHFVPPPIQEIKKRQEIEQLSLIS